jgi:hypothetical protein
MVVVFVLLLAIVPLLGQTDASCFFLSAEPSVINLGLGGRPAGNVNIWHNSALTTYSNPATAAFRKGISWGFREGEWLSIPNLGISTGYNASLVNVHYKGFTITLPTYKLSEQSGVLMDYGQMSYYENGLFAGTFHSYDSAKVYGLAFDAMDWIQTSWLPEGVNENTNLAIGVNYVDVSSHLAPSQHPVGNGRGNTVDFGSALRYTHQWDESNEFELVGAYSHHNMFRSSIEWGMNLRSPIWEVESTGLALAYNGKAQAILQDLVKPELIFCDNLYSLRFLSSKTSQETIHTSSWGVEAGLLDTFFIRKGRYKAYQDEVFGETFGYGIDLHYKDLISLSWNYATYPHTATASKQKAEDLNANVNFLAMGKLIAGMWGEK